MSEELRVKSEERTAKAKMTAEQKDLLAAAKSLDADVERAKELSIVAEHVLGEMCKSCGQTKACKKLGGLPKVTCRQSAIASVAVGMIEEKCKSNLETSWELLHGRMAALKAEQKGGAK